MAQLAEWSHPTPDYPSSNPAVCKFYKTIIFLRCGRCREHKIERKNRTAHLRGSNASGRWSRFKVYPRSKLTKCPTRRRTTQVIATLVLLPLAADKKRIAHFNKKEAKVFYLNWVDQMPRADGPIWRLTVLYHDRHFLKSVELIKNTHKEGCYYWPGASLGKLFLRKSRFPQNEGIEKSVFWCLYLNINVTTVLVSTKTIL